MNGVVNILKPTGMTSHDVVNKVRRKFNIKKIGHTGTLDPNCAGVLPILIGKAAKLSDFFINKDKNYRCTMCFGYSTDSLDSYGKVVSIEKNISNIPIKKIIKTLDKFIGEIEQEPPIYSAIKINGEKLYKKARKGEVIDGISKRKIFIHSIDLVDYKFPYLTFDVKCSKGTYIRSLVRDIALNLDTVAHMGVLIRISSGQFSINNSVTLENLGFNDIIDVDDLDLGFGQVFFNEKQIKYYIQGKKIYIKDILVDDIEKSDYFKIYDEKNNLISIAYIEKNTGIVKNKILFRG